MTLLPAVFISLTAVWFWPVLFCCCPPFLFLYRPRHPWVAAHHPHPVFPNNTDPSVLQARASLGELPTPASLAHAPAEELIQPLRGQEGNLPRDTPCYFSFLFLPRAPRGGYLPGNIPCHAVCWKQRTIADLSLLWRIPLLQGCIDVLMPGTLPSNMAL